MKIDKLILKVFLSLMLVLFLSSASFGQNHLKLGNKSFKKGNYSLAVKHYNNYLKKYSDRDVFLKRGICNYHCGRYKAAIEDLQNSKYLGNFDNRIDKYLAFVYHEKQDFENAIVYYKKLLAKFKGNKKAREEITNNIKRCSNGVVISYSRPNHFIENCGTDINSKSDEILPIQSPSDSSLFYFASNRGYPSDKKEIFDEFIVAYEGGSWEEIPPVITENSKREGTVFLDFYNYGNEAIVFRGKYLNSGELYSYGYSGKSYDSIVKKKFAVPVYTKSDFTYFQFVNDSTIVFSSNQKGGYGGYDIYISGYRDGHWFKPINLGPNINTKFDEISPYMTPDAENLYYSSNGLKSIGGFDILHSQFSHAQDDWLESVNIGLPINSPFDEYGYRFLKSGKGGIFNSNRKDIGVGGQDLYWVYYKTTTPVYKVYSEEVPFLKHKPLVSVEYTKKNEKNKQA